MKNMDNWLSDYGQRLADLTAENLPSLAPVLAEDLEFRDPFNHTYRKEQFIAIMADMFSRLDQVKFEVHNLIVQGNEGTLYWNFSASSRITGHFSFEGCSRIVRDNNGLICLHRDYWDGSELMQQLPVLGAVIGKVRSKMSHS